MRRGMVVLAGLLLVQLALAGLLAIRTDPLRSTTPDQSLLRGPVAAADHLVIESRSAPGEPPESTRVELSRHERGWTIDNYFNAPAAAARVDAMLGRLAGLKRGLPIATSSAALQRFRVAEADFARKVTIGQAGKTLGAVYFGNSAGVRSVDARSGDDQVVYTVDYATYEMPVQPADWLDGDLLRRRVEDLHSIDIDYGDQRPLRLERQAAKEAGSAGGGTAGGGTGGWQATPPSPGKALSDAHADALAQALAGVHVDSILGTEAKPEWEQAHPLMQWTLGGPGDARETWILSKPEGNAELRVLKSSAHPWYFAISSSAATALLTASGREQLFAAAGAAKPVPGAR